LGEVPNQPNEERRIRSIIVQARYISGCVRPERGLIIEPNVVVGPFAKAFPKIPLGITQVLWERELPNSALAIAVYDFSFNADIGDRWIRRKHAPVLTKSRKIHVRRNFILHAGEYKRVQRD
jgi:hypothetical protein